jgi:TolB-like protein/Tfp pilus assembly protein PilF
MGEVYRAKDLRLGREVALKVLPGDVSANPERLARFEREARTVAALNHPNIVTLYSVEDEGQVRFITMELVDGQSLDHVITPGGLPAARVAELGIALADALAAAHQKGVIHRDLKPANVMLTRDGRVKVLDFGLAKIAAPQADPQVSQAATLATLSVIGEVMGTVPYMAPEQLRGEPVDARTDLFALGVVLYELSSGTRPFTGATLADISSGILRDTPSPLQSVREDLPVGLGTLVSRCLEKAPRDRIQTAAEAGDELRRLRKELDLREAGLSPGSGRFAAARPSSTARATRAPGANTGKWIVAIAAMLVLALAFVLVAKTTRRSGAAAKTAAGETATAPPEHSIAVLPFLDLSPGRDQDYFASGVSEELLNLLARIPQLQVIARTSSFSFKDKQIAIPEIAKQLHVRHVLEGSVRVAGHKMRITAELIDGATDTHVWSQTYDRGLEDVFAMQDQIAADVVEQLKVTLLGAAPKVRETKPEAYEMFLQAVQFTRLRSQQGYASADSLLHLVLAMDPQYVPAWNVLAASDINEVNLGLIQPPVGLQRAKEAATKAVTIDPDYARAYGTLGAVALFSGDVAGAARHFERALALAPSDPNVLGNSSAVLKTLGRAEDAMRLDEATVRIDPMNAIWLFNLGAVQNWAGHSDKAVSSLHSALNLSPNYAGAHLVLGEALIHLGKPADALAEVRQEAHPAFKSIGLALAFQALGQKSDADTALASLIAHYGKDAPYDIAYVYAFRREPDRAFEWLDRAVGHDASMTLILVENLFDPIHDDPRWLRLLKKIGKDPETLARIPFHVAPAGT